MKTYTLRVTYCRDEDAWADITVSDSNTLDLLHLAIQHAFDLDNDHAWSFYLGRRLWDKATEYGCPQSDCERMADETTFASLKLRKGRKFLYLFDFGDEHVFDLQITETGESESRKDYPQILKVVGKVEQYAEY